MFSLKRYAGLTLLALLGSMLHALLTKGQFYVAMADLSRTKTFSLIYINVLIIFSCLLWQLFEFLFLGSVREAEIDNMKEQLQEGFTDICCLGTLLLSIERSRSYFWRSIALLMIKVLHSLAKKRVEYIETTLSMPLLSHVRIVAFMVLLLIMDFVSLYSSLNSSIRLWAVSAEIIFLFQYAIAAVSAVSTSVAYVFYASDMVVERQEQKAAYKFYLDLVNHLLHLFSYISFAFIFYQTNSLPIYLLHQVVHSVFKLLTHVGNYIRYQEVTSELDKHIRDATPKELTESDATCIICREEMIAAKKLRCGHLFHVQCLLSWLEQQNACPTCKALVISSEHTAVTQSQQHQISSQRGTMNQENSDMHSARLEAAARAASVYEKSMMSNPCRITQSRRERYHQ